MKSARSLLLAVFFLPVIAQAHPGHDGDHELIWDFEHFASHPLASLACAAVIVTAGWIVWRLLKSYYATRPGTIERPDSKRR